MKRRAKGQRIGDDVKEKEYRKQNVREREREGEQEGRNRSSSREEASRAYFVLRHTRKYGMERNEIKGIRITGAMRKFCSSGPIPLENVHKYK